jgi:hypothetical protein
VQPKATALRLQPLGDGLLELGGVAAPDGLGVDQLDARVGQLGLDDPVRIDRAAYGYCPSKSQFVWGMRLVLLCYPRGVPVGYDLVGPKTGEERDCALRLASAHPDTVLFADGGFWGRELGSSIEALRIELVTPEKHRLGECPPAEIAKARIRLVVESAGLAQRIAQRLLALTVGVYVNTLLGRPPRALAAYDGR